MKTVVPARARSWLALSCLLLAVAACTQTEQPREVRTSGFLYDYSRLEPGGEGRSQLVYINPDADFSRYDAVLFEPVSVWIVPSETPVQHDRQQLQDLANAFHAAVSERLQEDYRLTTVPGPGVLRLRMALTEAEESTVSMDIVSMVIPVATIASWGNKMATGTHAFVGKAGVEAEFSDSRSGLILAAAVDRRVGGKDFTGSTDSWGDVMEAFRYWADRVIEGLREQRAASEGRAP